ncbi:11710_t:CDS:2, partial [Scutellospora calospora]
AQLSFYRILIKLKDDINQPRELHEVAQRLRNHRAVEMKNANSMNDIAREVKEHMDPSTAIGSYFSESPDINQIH